jgi:hypothetical protein
MSEFLSWSDAAIGTWGSSIFTWEEVALVQDIINNGGVDTTSVYNYTNKLSTKKKKKLIKIIVKLKNEEYIKSVYKSDKVVKIDINDIEFLIKNKDQVKVTVIN